MRRGCRQRSETRHAAARWQHAATAQTAHAAHQFGHATLAADLLHHLLHLLVLLDDAADILDLGTGTGGDATLARATDDIRVAPLGRGHGGGDGRYLRELLIGL